MIKLKKRIPLIDQHDKYGFWGGKFGGSYIPETLKKPVEDLTVFPCIGSQDQITFKPSFLIALINLGKNFSTLLEPNLDINVSLPGSFSGFKILHNLINSSGFNVGPHLSPIGFFIHLQNSTCAPSGCLVLSPIQTKCAEVS